MINPVIPMVIIRPIIDKIIPNAAIDLFSTFFPLIPKINPPIATERKKIEMGRKKYGPIISLNIREKKFNEG